MTASALDRDRVTGLVRSELREVLGRTELPPVDADLEEDLAADSLDLVETIERVEAALRRDGFDVTVAEERIRSLRTVADAVTEILEAANP